MLASSFYSNSRNRSTVSTNKGVHHSWISSENNNILISSRIVVHLLSSHFLSTTITA